MARCLNWILLALVLAPWTAVHATAQQSDELSINGKSYALNTNPLQPHLQAIGWKAPPEAVIWSSNWRGYLAQWRIEDGQLVLVDVTIAVRDEDGKDESAQSIREQLFPDTPRVVATWFSGALVIPDGEMVDYVHMGYGTTYDYYQIIRITEGQVMLHLSLDREQFEDYKAAQFRAYAKTEEFERELKTLLKDGKLGDEEEVIDFMKSFYAERYLSLPTETEG